MPPYLRSFESAVAGGLTMMLVSSTHKPAAALHFSPAAHGEHVPRLSVKTPGEFSKNGVWHSRRAANISKSLYALHLVNQHESKQY
jgi:hypothetical protein